MTLSPEHPLTVAGVIRNTDRSLARRSPRAPRRRRRWPPINDVAHQDRPTMHLTPREVDKLMIFTAGELARKRRDRGVKLNHPEAVALILGFDRAAAYGMRLNIPAGTAVRFEPGDTRDVELVAIGGTRVVAGLNRLVEGALDDPDVRRRALEAVKVFGT